VWSFPCRLLRPCWRLMKSMTEVLKAFRAVGSTFSEHGGTAPLAVPHLWSVCPHFYTWHTGRLLVTCWFSALLRSSLFIIFLYSEKKLSAVFSYGRMVSYHLKAFLVLHLADFLCSPLPEAPFQASVSAELKTFFFGASASPPLLRWQIGTRSTSSLRCDECRTVSRCGIRKPCSFPSCSFSLRFCRPQVFLPFLVFLLLKPLDSEVLAASRQPLGCPLRWCPRLLIRLLPPPLTALALSSVFQEI